MRGMPLLSVTMANSQVKTPVTTQSKAQAKTQLKVKGSKVNRAWINDHVNDPYVKLAKREGYRARAAYKLKEIDESFGLIKPGHLVVDLGSVPGAWSQYLRRKFSPKSATGGGSAAGALPSSLPGALNGTIIALDILPMEPIEGVVFLQGDFREAEVLDRLVHEMAGRLADVVVSDMAPNLTGIESVDAARGAHLIELRLIFAGCISNPRGLWWP